MMKPIYFHDGRQQAKKVCRFQKVQTYSMQTALKSAGRGQDLSVEAIARHSTAWFGRQGALVRSPVVEAKDCFVQRFAHTFSFQKVVNLIVSNSVGLLIRTLRCQVLQIGYGYFANQGGRRAQC